MMMRAAGVPFCFLIQVSLVACGPDTVAFTQAGGQQRGADAGPMPFEADATASVSNSVPEHGGAADASDPGDDLDELPSSDGVAEDQSANDAEQQMVVPGSETIVLAENPASEVSGLRDDASDIIDMTSESLTLSDINDLCSTTPRQTKVHEVVFPARNEGCFWGQEGNLDPFDGIVHARSEEIVSLNLNEAETLCSIRLESPAQEIIFDDELFLTFNDAILLSSYNYNAHFSLRDGLYIYSWEAMIGGFNPGPYSSSESYCVGDGNSVASICEIPVTDTIGRFFIDVVNEEAEKLSLLSKQQKRADIGLIVTGDDDEKDCSHSEIRVSIELTTVGGPALIAP